MTDHWTQNLIQQIVNSLVEESDLYVISSKESLEMLVTSINILSSTREDIERSMRTLTRILNYDGSVYNDLANMPDITDANIVTLFSTYADYLDSLLSFISEQLKHSHITPLSSSEKIDIKSMIRKRTCSFERWCIQNCLVVNTTTQRTNPVCSTKVSSKSINSLEHDNVC